MTDRRGFRGLRTCVAISLLAGATALSGCSSSTPKASLSKQTRSSEYFPESVYGKASPRMTELRTRLPRGGGRDQVGKPYQVAGKWYYPKEQPGYVKKGKASWYGDAFHGRLTANGEIYDMTHLTAAHPTMPLPSYARVTNLKNGSSVIVRVNDRGPFAHDRVIDLSSKAAEMLDYKHSGIADVKVEYVGRAPLEGSDDSYLLASYRPGKDGPDPSDGLPSGVLIAMAGPTPVASTGSIGGSPATAAVSAFPGNLYSTGAVADSALELPDEGPVIADRPLARAATPQGAGEALGYAAEPVSRASSAFAALGADASPADDTTGQGAGAYVAVGTFDSREEAERIAATLAPIAVPSIEEAREGKTVHFALAARAKRETGLDALLQGAWDAGATDAFVVRD